MQCPSCGFQNMPGNEGCARCGSSLRVATMVMDVHPPRAAEFSGFVRRFKHLVRWPARVAERRIPRVEIPALPSLWLPHWDASWELLPRLIIPGWSQFHAGLLGMGYFYAGSFAFSLALGLLFWGSGTGAVMLASAFIVHQTAIADVFNRISTHNEYPSRVRRGILIVLALLLLVYAPGYWMVTQVAQAVIPAENMGPINAGDVVLVNHLSHARPGQLVLFDIPAHIVTRDRGRYRENFGFGGPTIDRVLAVAGDHVVWNNGQLFVNGGRSLLKPLIPLRLPPRLSMTVPDGDVLIFPTTAPDTINGDMLQSLSSVPLSQVTGQVYWRWGPLRRFGRIR